MRPRAALGTVTQAARRVLRRMGMDVIRYRDFPPDFGTAEMRIIESVRPYTMTSPERLFSLIEAVRYVVKHHIPGAIVECGVWKGGSMMAAARTLLELDAADRDLYLFDTFEGMTAPGAEDIRHGGRPAAVDFHREWLAAPLPQVQQALTALGYDPERLHFVKGDVEETIPAAAPEVISVLRLDTDWYASTRHELRHLFPRLSSRGVLIIDDYGHWHGARQAVDEYVAEIREPLLLNRIDYSGRIAVKP